MKYSISIDHNLKIIKYRHQGIITAEEIENVWTEFLQMKEFTELKYNLFSDYRNSKFDIPPEFLPELMNYMESIKDIVRGKKQSLIVEDPYSTAVSVLFENEVNAKIGFIVKVFSTPSEALKWLIS